MYVLIAVMLFGALSFMLTKQMDGNNTTNSLKQGTDRLKAEELINYTTAVHSAIEQMTVMLNILPNQINFIKPAEAGFTTEPHSAKLYHPAGGGITPMNPKAEIFKSGSAQRGWVHQQGTNVEWTASISSDVILTFLDLDDAICREINKRLYKDSSIPTTTIDSSAMLINGGADDADLTLASCPSCNQRPSYCVKDAAGDNAFYTVIIAR
jgi:hypothetical protein